MIETVTIVVNVLQVVVLLAACSRVITRLQKRGSSVVLGFFLYALICYLLSEVYWLALTVLKPDVRIPYAVNDVADTGLYLLFAATITELFRDKKRKFSRGMILTLIFAVFVIVFWIAWSGEWIKNFIGGIAFAYYMCVVALALRQTEALKKTEAVFVCILAFGEIAIQGASFFLKDTAYDIALYAGYALMFSGILWLSVRSIVMFDHFRRNRTKELADVAVTSAFLAALWCENSMYMSEDPWYIAAEVFFTALIGVITQTVISADSFRTEPVKE